MNTTLTQSVFNLTMFILIAHYANDVDCTSPHGGDTQAYLKYCEDNKELRRLE
jgi:hypothetical protein